MGGITANGVPHTCEKKLNKPPASMQSTSQDAPECESSDQERVEKNFESRLNKVIDQFIAKFGEGKLHEFLNNLLKKNRVSTASSGSSSKSQVKDFGLREIDGEEKLVIPYKFAPKHPIDQPERENKNLTCDSQLFPVVKETEGSYHIYYESSESNKTSSCDERSSEKLEDTKISAVIFNENPMNDPQEIREDHNVMSVGKSVKRAEIKKEDTLEKSVPLQHGKAQQKHRVYFKLKSMYEKFFDCYNLVSELLDAIEICINTDPKLSKKYYNEDYLDDKLLMFKNCKSTVLKQDNSYKSSVFLKDFLNYTESMFESIKSNEISLDDIRCLLKDMKKLAETVREFLEYLRSLIDDCCTVDGCKSGEQLKNESRSLFYKLWEIELNVKIRSDVKKWLELLCVFLYAFVIEFEEKQYHNSA